MIRMAIIQFTFLLSACIIVTSCAQSDDDVMDEVNDPVENEDTTSDSGAVTFLALGDSYTIGQGVAVDDTWPEQLEAKLLLAGFDVETEIVARSGWTTGDLLAALKGGQNSASQYGLVSLLIGVNNQYQGKSIDEFEIEFDQLLNKAVSLASNRAERVFVLSIPDYSVTPFAQADDPDNIQSELEQFNARKKQITASYGVKYFDITDLSRRAANDLSLLASDQLHPSADMYTLWVSRIESQVTDLIN